MYAVFIDSEEHAELLFKYVRECEKYELRTSLSDFMVWLEEAGYELKEAE